MEGSQNEKKSYKKFVSLINLIKFSLIKPPMTISLIKIQFNLKSVQKMIVPKEVDKALMTDLINFT